MMRPTPPSGSSKLAILLRWMYDRINAIEITSVAGGEIKRSSTGTQLIIKPGRNTQEVGGSGLKFRGEWVSGASYEVDDVVVIYDGAAQGTYVCVKATSSATPVQQTSPQHGTFWSSLPMGSSVGAWT